MKPPGRHRATGRPPGRPQLLLSLLTLFTVITNANAQDCSEAVDVALLLDSSVSLGESGLRAVRDFATSLTSRLDISLDLVRVAVVSFSSDQRIGLRLSESTDRGVVDGRIYEVRLATAPGTDLRAAIERVNRDIFVAPGDRPFAPNKLVIITDAVVSAADSSQEVTRILAAANRLRDEKLVDIYSLFVASSDTTQNEQLMALLGSRRQSVADVLELARYRDAVVSWICRGVDSQERCGPGDVTFFLDEKRVERDGELLRPEKSFEFLKIFTAEVMKGLSGVDRRDSGWRFSFIRHWTNREVVKALDSGHLLPQTYDILERMAGSPRDERTPLGQILAIIQTEILRTSNGPNNNDDVLVFFLHEDAVGDMDFLRTASRRLRDAGVKIILVQIGDFFYGKNEIVGDGRNIVTIAARNYSDLILNKDYLRLLYTDLCSSLTVAPPPPGNITCISSV